MTSLPFRTDGCPRLAGPGVVDVLVGAVPEHVLALGRPGHRPRRPGESLAIVRPERPAREPRRAGLDAVPLVEQCVVRRTLNPDVEPARRPGADPGVAGAGPAQRLEGVPAAVVPGVLDAAAAVPGHHVDAARGP